MSWEINIFLPEYKKAYSIAAFHGFPTKKPDKKEYAEYWQPTNSSERTVPNGNADKREYAER